MKRIICLWVLLVCVGCGHAVATAVPSPTPLATLPPTASPTAVALAPTVTATLAPTATAGPTATPAATATPEFVILTATPVAQAPKGERPFITPLTQPAYAASDCSDKYPCNDDIAAWEARIRVPEGFTARYLARIDGWPTAMTFGPDGLLYVAALDGTIYTIDSDGLVMPLIAGFLAPTGLAFQPGTANLYIASRVSNEGLNGEAQISLLRNGKVRQIVGGLPCCYAGLHAANGIAFGPDGYGYVGVGARADHGEIIAEGPNKGKQDELHPLEAAILRFSPDGRLVEPYVHGLRNPYDIAWDADGNLYATDNAPDFGPPEEFHRLVPGGQHGYPWYTCDDCFAPPPNIELVEPVQTFLPHSAPTGVTAYLADQFPGYYNGLFVALWSAFRGAQKVVYLDPGGEKATDFALGFAQPVDVTVGATGNLYVVDHATGIIFEIFYSG